MSAVGVVFGQSSVRAFCIGALFPLTPLLVIAAFEVDSIPVEVVRTLVEVGRLEYTYVDQPFASDFPFHPRRAVVVFAASLLIGLACAVTARILEANRAADEEPA